MTVHVLDKTCEGMEIKVSTNENPNNKDILYINGNVITLNGESSTIDKLNVCILDYGDAYFDLGFQKENGDLLGRAGWCVIHITKINEIAKQLSEITGINTIVKDRG